MTSAVRAIHRGAPGRSRSLAWPVALTIVVALGAGLVVLSRDAGTVAVPPTFDDHWHAAYGVYVCDSYLAPFADNMATAGIHTHADGLIHVEPRSSLDTGANATVARFAEGVGLEISQGRLQLPDGTTYADGDECDGEPADVRILVDGEPVDAEPDDIPLVDGEPVAFVFAPADAEVPPVPSRPEPPAGRRATT